MNSNQILYSSEVQEFFWEDSDKPVDEGTPIGIEIEKDSNIDLVMFDDIYWSDKNLVYI